MKRSSVNRNLNTRSDNFFSTSQTRIFTEKIEQPLGLQRRSKSGQLLTTDICERSDHSQKMSLFDSDSHPTLPPTELTISASVTEFYSFSLSNTQTIEVISFAPGSELRSISWSINFCVVQVTQIDLLPGVSGIPSDEPLCRIYLGWGSSCAQGAFPC
jgi:hypothetical protein